MLDWGITCVLREDRYSNSFEASQQFLGTSLPVANQMIHCQGKLGNGVNRNATTSKSNERNGKAVAGTTSKKSKVGGKALQKEHAIY